MPTLFTKIINREIPAKIIYEDDKVLAFLDLAQDTKGHTLVIPKEHTESVLSASDEVIAYVNTVARDLALKLMKVYGAKGVNILTNANPIAGQTVFHYHVHILPRYDENELKLVSTSKKSTLDEVYETYLNYKETED
jgi:histidine triad (HIT) family protein